MLFGCSPEVKFDVIILNGTVYEGNLSDPKKIDIGIVNDRIIEIGNLEARQSSRIIE